MILDFRLLRAGFLNLWHYEHFGLENSLLWQVVLNIIGFLAASLISTHLMPVALAPYDKQKCFQTLPNIPPWAKLSLVENHCLVEKFEGSEVLGCYTSKILEFYENLFC